MNKLKLVTLSGNGAADMALLKTNVRELNDIDAGIVVLWQIARMVPGITWQDMIDYSQNRRMSGPFDWIGDAGTWVGDKISDAGDMVGGWVGSGVRLVTDEKVQTGLTRGAAAYMTGGQSLALENLLQGAGGDLLGNLLGSVGGQAKQQTAISPAMIYIGGGLLAFILIIMMLKK